MALHHPIEERDACAIIAFVDKRGRSTHANIVKTVDALKKMAHRSGDIGNEGDGCGILTDLPRTVWGKRLEDRGLSRHLSESRSFYVGHLFLPHDLRARWDEVMACVRNVFSDHGVDILAELKGNTRDHELGSMARQESPLFWQVCGLVPDSGETSGREKLFNLQLALERAEPLLHIASLSMDSVVFKVRGTPDLLSRVFPELMDGEMRSVITLGHSRYSTNTLPTVERSQPFSLLGHNGEINTIEKLRSYGKGLGIDPVPGGSDSQDLNRIMEGLIHLHGFDAMEALEILFPAVHSRVKEFGPGLQSVYDFYRWYFPPSAQGPAAVIKRFGPMCLGSVDALGLRPLWLGESDYDYFLSSEKGVVNLQSTVSDPRPLAPGEKVAILSSPGQRAELIDYGGIQKRLLRSAETRSRLFGLTENLHTISWHGRRGEKSGASLRDFYFSGGSGDMSDLPVTENLLKGFGWQKYDQNMRKTVAETGDGPIGSMGYQGPLACMAQDGFFNISEYFKENVAVVTNPAIDREREAEHFSTRLILGARPEDPDSGNTPVGIKLETPVLMGGEFSGSIPLTEWSNIAGDCGTTTLEEVLDFITGGGRDSGKSVFLDATFDLEKGIFGRLAEMEQEAREAVARGAVILVIDDSRSFRNGRCFIDPGLAVAWLVRGFEKDRFLRKCSLIVRSGAIRNLHDIMFLLGLGADCVNPYMLWKQVLVKAEETSARSRALVNTMAALQKGMEKVMSAMGIHELCGYGRIFSSIGLKKELQDVFQCPGFCVGDVGLGFSELTEAGRERYRVVSREDAVSLWRDYKRNPIVGRLLRMVALGRAGYLLMDEEMASIDREHPVGIRHLLDFAAAPEPGSESLDGVDISVGDHSMPLVISAMSFGSQGENSFRAYAEAAFRAGIVCMNGEGGEIPDMMGLYRKNRGQQVASGRFGVSMSLLNSADFLEIKVGQGAKPGEGGHLPGSKVTGMVARARHCLPGVPLISPSNHHDIYSIEDLCQIITELKTANPQARISVKIPVTSGVGTIAVGVAKAGAHIVTISGYDGGTGAAREHARKYVGLPVEIGVAEAHAALVESGLRSMVEIWCDGGVRSGADVVKLVCLGANRVGLGTVALMGVGCISCERCHLDTCPRGISTQLRSEEEALARGIKRFSVLRSHPEAENLARLLNAIGDQVRMIVSRLGKTRITDLVGRSDLLVQGSGKEMVDLSSLLRPVSGDRENEEGPVCRMVRTPLNNLTRLISGLAMDAFSRGDDRVQFREESVRSVDRAVGTFLAGNMVRELPGADNHLAELEFLSSVPGNGLCAFNVEGIDTVVRGGGQDGIAKGARGGTICILKGVNLLGDHVDGSVGKSFAYGAIGGTLMVQNFADSRACIRMSGADAVFGGRITEKVRDDLGNIATRAHLKGFAFEYMTGGRVVVLGDPGPWMCAGMTGGTVYLCLYPEFDFTVESVERRIARGANVVIQEPAEDDLIVIRELLSIYVQKLKDGFQGEEAFAVEQLMDQAEQRFIAVVPSETEKIIAE